MGTAPLWVCRWAAQSDYRSFHAAALWPRELFPRGQERIDPEKAPPTFVNQEAFPEKVDLQKVRALHNPAYPIEVALFNDAKFYYYLENLGDGKGSWKYEDGSLYLYAERLMFVMEMEIHSVEESGEEIIIDFEDRHGPKWLPLDKRI